MRARRNVLVIEANEEGPKERKTLCMIALRIGYTAESGKLGQ